MDISTPAVYRSLGRDEINAIPLAELDVSSGYIFEDDTVGMYFERLRREAPVHYCARSRFGPFWSVTTYRHIMEVEVNHQAFSSDSALGGITLALGDGPLGLGDGKRAAGCRHHEGQHPAHHPSGHCQTGTPRHARWRGGGA